MQQTAEPRADGGRGDGDFGLGAVGCDKPAPTAAVRVGIAGIDSRPIEIQPMDEIPEVRHALVVEDLVLVLETDDEVALRAGRRSCLEVGPVFGVFMAKRCAVGVYSQVSHQRCVPGSVHSAEPSEGAQ